MQEWVDLVEGSTYDVTLKNLNFNKSGTYQCFYMTADIMNMPAQLMVLGEYMSGFNIQV